MLRREREDEDHGGAEQGVGPKEPGLEAGAAAAEEVIAGKDGERRDGWQDVAGELGVGKREEDDGHEGPEDEELGEGVAGAGVAEVGHGLAANFPLGEGDADGVDEGAEGKGCPGKEAEDEDDEVVVDGLMMLEAVGGEALQIVLKEEDCLRKVGLRRWTAMYQGQDHYEEEGDTGPPNGAAEECPLAAEGGEEEDDEERQEGCDGALGESGGGTEEVEIEEPELFAGFIPGVPAEHADAEGAASCMSVEAPREKLSMATEERVMRAASRWPPGRKRRMCRKDEEDEEAGTGGGGEPGGPVGDAELTKEAHGSPVVEGGLFKPRLAVEDGRDGAGDEALVGIADVVCFEAVREELGVEGVACLVVFWRASRVRLGRSGVRLRRRGRADRRQ